MSEIKKIGADFLLDSGLLFKINRDVLHPFGMALEVICWDSDDHEYNQYLTRIRNAWSDIKAKIDSDSPRLSHYEERQYKDILVMLEELLEIKKQQVRLGGIWDYRDDPEGMVYEEKTFEGGKVKLDKFMEEFGNDKLKSRMELLGYIIQGEE